MTYILGYNSTANAGSIGNSGTPYYSKGTGGADGGYSNASNATIENICINITGWNAVTGLKVNLCDSDGTSLRIVEFVPADGTGLLTKTVGTAYSYTGGTAKYLEILTTGGTGYVESYRSTTSFSCRTGTGTYASPGNISPGTDSSNSNFEPFVYADGTISSSGNPYYYYAQQ